MAIEPGSESDIDPHTAALNAREAWRLRRAGRLPAAQQFDSQSWLGEALDGARLGLALNDQTLLERCTGEACALAIGSALARRVGAAELLLVDGPDGELRMPAAAPLASQWQQVVAIAIAGGEEAVLTDLALLAAHPVLEPAANGGERYRAALAEALLGAAYQMPGLDATVAQLAKLAATPAERRTAAALGALLAPPASPIKLGDEGFDTLALAALARERRHAVTVDGALVPLPPCRFPTACVAAPPRIIRLPREADWFFQVRGLPGTVAQLGHDGPADTRALLSAADGRWRLRADFVDAASTSTAERLAVREPALDPGELLILADQLAAQVDEQPPHAAAERDRQRGLLADALAIFELLISLCDAGSGRVPDAAFTTEDGRAEHKREPGRFEAERLAAVAGVYRRILDDLEDAAAGGQNDAAPARADPGPRDCALDAIEVLREGLAPLLRALARDRDGTLASTLRPRDGDHGKVFPGLEPGAVERAYRQVWAAEPVPRLPRAEQTELICELAPAGMLGHDNELSKRFPAGYRRIAPLLDPHRVWVRWKFVRPGEQAGMAYDGLVWVDDHWAWFPKPYRALATLFSTN